jgi:hypothetical protein
MKTKKITHLLILFLVTISFNSFGHWTTKGPYVGGNVKCFAVADTLLYVGSANGGVYWSRNKALTAWQYVNYTGLTSPNITAFTSIGLTSSLTGMKVIAGTSDAGVFMSRDKGLTWTAYNTGLTNTHVTALINMGQYIFAGTNGGGVFVSSDSAKTWSAVNTGITNNVVTCFTTNGTVIAVGTDGGGVFVSINNGGSWTAANTGLTNLSVNALAISGTTIFAGTDSGIFTANTSVPVWSQANTGLTNTIINGFATNAGVVYAATNNGVYTSPDASVTWTSANTGLADTVTAIAVFNNKLYAGNHKNGIYKSNSLSTISWSMFNTGFNNLEAHTVYNSGLLVVVATNKGLYVSRDLAASYQSANANLTDSLHITSLTFAGTKLFVATQYGGIFVSPDTGRTWTTANMGLSTLNIKRIISTNSMIVAAATNGNVFSTSESLINWSATSGFPDGLDITSLATDGTHVFLGTNGSGVYSSSNGSSWVSFNTGLTNMNVTSLAVKDSKVFAGTNGGGIFRSLISGSSWTAVNNGLPTLNILSLCASDQFVAAGYKGGVHATSSDGYEWKPTNVILYIPSYADVHTLSFTSSSTRIFAATPYNTIYSNGVAELPITATDPLALFSPVNTIGRIGISPNPNDGNFKLDLSDVAGVVEEITIYNYAGEKTGYFNSSKDQMIQVDYPQGIYFVHIVTSKGSGTQKVVIE